MYDTYSLNYLGITYCAISNVNDKDQTLETKGWRERRFEICPTGMWTNAIPTSARHTTSTRATLTLNGFGERQGNMSPITFSYAFIAILATLVRLNVCHRRSSSVSTPKLKWNLNLWFSSTGELRYLGWGHFFLYGSASIPSVVTCRSLVRSLVRLR